MLTSGLVCAVNPEITWLLVNRLNNSPQCFRHMLQIGCGKKNFTVFALFDYTTTINSVTPWNIQEQCGKCCRFQEKPKKLGRSILCSVNVAVHSCNAYVLSCYCRMTMTVYYLVHYEQLSLESYEYIDCGANTTVPHSMQPPPPW